MMYRCYPLYLETGMEEFDSLEEVEQLLEADMAKNYPCVQYPSSCSLEDELRVKGLASRYGCCAVGY